MSYQISRHQELESDDSIVWAAARELYLFFYPNESKVIPLAARSTGSQQFLINVVTQILEESGLLYGDVDHFAIATAIHQLSCPNESKVISLDDLSEWRQGVYLGWAQRVIDSVIGNRYDA